jgi:putative hydrolase
MQFFDLHVHSIRSSCGFHTVLELAGIMREKGAVGFALTDHGPALGTPRAHFSVLVRRMPSMVQSMRLFKGIEASIMDGAGTLDLPAWDGYPYEIVLAGIHPHDYFESSRSEKEHTAATVNAMRAHPEITAIVHPYHAQYPIDMDALTDAACETGIALEINNSHLLTRKADTDRLARMLELAAAKGTRIVVNSDGHLFNEVGEFGCAIAAIEQFGPDRLNIVNRTLESTLRFLGLEG